MNRFHVKGRKMKTNTMKKIAACACLISGTALFGTASAHVVLEYQVAPAGASYKATFKVGHGCGASPTRQVVVDIPEGFKGARPQPKPGWTLEIERQDGKVTAVTWRGELPDDQFDEFAMLFKLPDQPATLYSPTVQSCGADESQWTEIPSAGERASHPAPALVVTPKAAAAETHQH